MTSNTTETLDRLVRLADHTNPRIAIKGATILTMEGDPGVIHGGDIVIEAGKIVALGRGAADAVSPASAVVIDGSRMIVTPGFVDTHRHSWGALMRQMPMVGSYDTYSNSMHQGYATQYTPQDMYAGGLLAALTAVDSGVTTLVDWSHNSRTSDHSDAAIQALFDSGLRGVYAFAAPRFNAPDHQHPGDIPRLQKTWFKSDDQLVTMVFGTFRRASTNEVEWRPEGTAEPRPDLAEHLRIAREHGLRISVEGCSSPPSSEDLIRLHAEGLLGPDTTYIHCRDLTHQAWQAIADSGGSVSIAPGLTHGARQAIPSTQDAIDHGLRPSVSLDTEFNRSNDFVRVLEMLTHLQRANAQIKVIDGDPNPPKKLSAREVLEFGTIEGAKANGMGHQTGSVAVGKDADLNLFDVDRINAFPVHDPFNTVLLASTGANLKGVLVAGRAVKWDGKLVGVNLDQVRAMVERASEGLVARTKLTLSPAEEKAAKLAATVA